MVMAPHIKNPPDSPPTAIRELMRPRATRSHWQAGVRLVPIPGSRQSTFHVFVACENRLLFTGEIRKNRPLPDILLDAIQTTALIRMEWPQCLEMDDAEATRHIGSYLQSVIPLTLHRVDLAELDGLVNRIHHHVVAGNADYPDEENPEAGASPQFVAAMLHEAHRLEFVHSGNAHTRDSNRSPRAT